MKTKDTTLAKEMVEFVETLEGTEKAKEKTKKALIDGAIEIYRETWHKLLNTAILTKGTIKVDNLEEGACTFKNREDMQDFIDIARIKIINIDLENINTIKIKMHTSINKKTKEKIKEILEGHEALNTLHSRK